MIANVIKSNYIKAVTECSKVVGYVNKVVKSGDSVIHLLHYLTSDYEHYKTSDGFYYKCKQ